MKPLKDQFLIDPSITFLNFGSFGSCPKPVFEEYQKLQLELEREPVQFIMVNGAAKLENSRKALGACVNADHGDLVFVPNPSHAVNIVAKSLQLNPGDEVLSTDLEYGACDKAWEYYCAKAGAKYRRQSITLPLSSKDKFLEEFFAGLNSKTKVIFVSQITSSTGLIFPVKEVCEKAREKKILCIVDGAHTPGHVALDLRKLNADIFTGACHKWMMCPKGCSFLYVRKNIQHLFDPLVVSWGYDPAKTSPNYFIDYHQMQGTRDFSAYLALPAAIEFMKENNWVEVSNTCKKMVLDQAPRFAQLLNTSPLAPLSEEFFGQMLSLQIRCPEPELLQKTLFGKYKIEIPVMRHGTKTFLRFSLNAFNSLADLDKLYRALTEIKNQGKLLSA